MYVSIHTRTRRVTVMSLTVVCARSYAMAIANLPKSAIIEHCDVTVSSVCTCQ